MLFALMLCGCENYSFWPFRKEKPPAPAAPQRHEDELSAINADRAMLQKERGELIVRNQRLADELEQARETIRQQKLQLERLEDLQAENERLLQQRHNNPE